MRKRGRISQSVFDVIVGFLVAEHHRYAQRFPNDMSQLRRTLKPGDVVLVEGSQRISQIIKYLTQSSWSHAALYVGDTLIRQGARHENHFRDLYGDEADTLVIEANVETGVTAIPLSKYLSHNIRVCRPINLRPGDLSTVLATVSAQIGNQYDVSHIIDLLRYFLPVHGPWRRNREPGLKDRPRKSHEVICSSQIAMAFQKVRYPILPAIEEGDDDPVPASMLRRLIGSNVNNASIFASGVFTPCNPLLVTPRDFDLSPYFEVVKLGSDDRREFDYKKMKWSPPPAITGPKTERRSNKLRQLAANPLLNGPNRSS